ncbi:histidinol-phosphate/aromatic aminotransferase and cobyric acid decarboxylase [Kocuria tytonicola]|uniref:nucleotidyl transferase AbiEii/AbiGii toxin family protein n=1 Tax=Kocuria tytonicola TaxID=2055946 RepID=UPI000EF88EBF|nr:nucleotidyl transferase AbiEii/AbiGii toxin family protein [Kocuria tytonicola]RLZ04093.1 histidinol-phosphate/aromatic aminotransferase and cobyric acid decarboxylase [Kocuria tytonicola]
MNAEFPYRDGNALWAAVRSRAKTEASASGIAVEAIIRQFVVDRFLARVFASPRSGWVLKGGNAVLSRVHDARTTKDVDLLVDLTNLEDAVARLRAAVAADLGDHFRFVVTEARASSGGALQPGVEGCKVAVDAYCGVTRRHRFSVDLVTGSLMTAEPEVLVRPGLVPAVSPTHVSLYPVADHIADKVCATQTMYGTNGDQPSTRVRDLVDLVVFARTQHIDGTDLDRAIMAEWTHRSLPGQPFFAPPRTWGRLYPAAARRVPACGDVLTFQAALELTASFLDPVLEHTVEGMCWSPENRAWGIA